MVGGAGRSGPDRGSSSRHRAGGVRGTRGTADRSASDSRGRTGRGGGSRDWCHLDRRRRSCCANGGAGHDVAGGNPHGRLWGRVSRVPAGSRVEERCGVTVDASPLVGLDLTLAYDGAVVSEGLSTAIPPESFTVIVGPNGCGKSTLLKALARVLTPRAGSVMLDGNPITSYSGKNIARRLSLLPQAPLAPDAITVHDLVGRGRYPYQGLFSQWSSEDTAAVSAALHATGVAEFADRPVGELSGGQRQRVWIAMTLAQQTEIMLLDEPTTFLDIAHQVDVLDLCATLHDEGRTLVAVLHDLNSAARYATHLIVMQDGQVVTTGTPGEVLTSDLVEEVFGLPCSVVACPQTGAPLVIPADRRQRRHQVPA